MLHDGQFGHDVHHAFHGLVALCCLRVVGVPYQCHVVNVWVAPQEVESEVARHDTGQWGHGTVQVSAHRPKSHEAVLRDVLGYVLSTDISQGFAQQVGAQAGRFVLKFLWRHFFLVQLIYAKVAGL